LILTLFANAQSPGDKPAESVDSATAKTADPKLHADAIRLVEVSRTRQRIQDNLRQTVDDGGKQMMEKCPRCTVEYRGEWEKRFLERTNIDDYVAVFVRAYEKYFTDAEINELIVFQKEKEASKDASPPPALKEKLSSVMPSVLGEIMGGCAGIGAKLGAEIGAEIEREHPEYLKPETNKP